MAPPPLGDLTHLLAEVASLLSRSPGGESLSVSISSLAAALNPSAPVSGSASGTRVLDAALSLMCFDPQEVDRSRLHYLLRTIVSALSDSVSCQVVRTDERNGGGGGGEMLCFGSSVSPGDCRESCAALVEKLGDSGVAGHSYDLLNAAVKTELLSPRYWSLFTLPYYREDREASYEMGTTIPMVLTRHPSYQVLPSDGSIPPRYACESFTWAVVVLVLAFMNNC